MARAFFKISGKITHLLLWLGVYFFVLSSPPALANASDPFKDLSLELGLEIGNEEKDFKDAGFTVEKGRFLTYKIQLENYGSYTMNQVQVLMEAPDYLQYVPQSTQISSNGDPTLSLPDPEPGLSPLALGYQIETLSPQKMVTFTLQYQVVVPAQILDDPLYTLAWVHAWSPYSVVPVVSRPVETVISGQPVPAIQVEIVPSPPEGQAVNAGFFIEYLYRLHNVSGLPIDAVTLNTFLPAFTECLETCEVHDMGTLQPNEIKETLMSVQVAQNLLGASAIIHTGYDLSGQNMQKIEYRKDLIHPLDGLLVDEGEFTVTLDQTPDLILNSPNEYSLRADLANQTETSYLLKYKGRHRSFTYPSISGGNRKVAYQCKVYEHPYAPNAQFYAYNSEGGGCEYLGQCPVNSAPITFNTTTNLPEEAPKLLFKNDQTVQQKPFAYNGGPGGVNTFIKNGGQFSLPPGFSISRAIHNGLAGLIKALVTADINEDLWQYKRMPGMKEFIGECSCGEGCEYEVFRDVYHWQRVSRTLFQLKDDDETDVSVYTSTAWLKTQGGHVGSNQGFTHGAQTPANYVQLGVDPILLPSHLTPSSLYTPPGEVNADYMVFSAASVGSLKTDQADAAWVQTGVEFPYLQKGEPYDREKNPRDYPQDLLERQLYAPVQKSTLSSPLIETVELGDNTVIHHPGDLVIGKENLPDPVYLSGGQVRIYVEGDLYLNSNVFYKAEGITDYTQMPSVRIDARNIYIDGAVEEVELMLLARESFHSGESHSPLHILGDVIAKKSFWERKPLLQFNPEKFNEPSEYVIEDLRKYILPAPGDTQLPYDHTLWRQVNPATGEVWDNY